MSGVDDPLPATAELPERRLADTVAAVGAAAFLIGLVAQLWTSREAFELLLSGGLSVMLGTQLLQSAVERVAARRGASRWAVKESNLQPWD